jgi:hypothetical protein
MVAFNSFIKYFLVIAHIEIVFKMLGTPIQHGDFIEIVDGGGDFRGRGWVSGIFVKPEVDGNALLLNAVPLISFQDLPRRLQTKARADIAARGICLWFDERSALEVSPHNVASIFSAHFGKPTGDGTAIVEIVYCPQGSSIPRTRNIDERHRLPFERQRPLLPPLPGMVAQLKRSMIILLAIQT